MQRHQNNCSYKLPVHCRLHIFIIVIIIIVGLACALATGKISNALLQEQRQQLIATHQLEAYALAICKIVTKCGKNQTLHYFIYTSSKSHQQIDNLLYECLPKNSLLNLNYEHVKYEPERPHASLNFMLLPAHWSLTEGLKNLRFMLNNKQSRKHRHFYIFVWLQRPLDKLFRLLWSKGILNAIAFNGSQAAMSAHNDNQREFYTYEPYTPQGFLVKSCENLSDLFYDKLTNLQQAELRISMFTDYIRAIPKPDFQRNGYDAVDGLLAATIVKHLNASATYVLPSDNHLYGACLPNGSCTGVLGDVSTGRTHVAFNTRYTLQEEHKFVEELYPFYIRKLSLVVPAGELRPESLIFKRAFNNHLWRLLLFNFLLACLGYYLLQLVAVNLIGATQNERLSLGTIAEMLFKLQFGEPLQYLCRVGSLRLFIISWIICGYVITSVYFAKMESCFVHKSYEPDIDDPDEFRYGARFKHTPIYIADDLHKLLSKNISKKYHWIIKRATPIQRNFSGYQFGMDIVKETRNAAFVFRREITRDFLANTYDNMKNRPSFHSLKKYIFSLPRSYIVPLGSPFRYKFDALIALFFDHGILEHWLSIFVVHRKHGSMEAQTYYEALGTNLDGVETSELSFRANANRRSPLSAEVLQGVFYLWSFGVAVSVIVLFIELYKKRSLQMNHQAPKEAIDLLSY